MLELTPTLSHIALLLSSVTRLNDVREDGNTYNNRLDTTLADVFSLLSLFFLTIGRTRECPATYCQIASLRVSQSYQFTHKHTLRDMGLFTCLGAPLSFGTTSHSTDHPAGTYSK